MDIMKIFKFIYKKQNNYIEVSKMRQKFIRNRNHKKELNIKKYFYYDETSNYRKFRLNSKKNNGFNISLTETLVLGGMVCENEISDSSFKELMSQIKLKNNPPEIKSRHIYGSGGNYFNQINNKNLHSILRWIEKNKIFIHFTSHCTGYNICEQIINSIDNSGDEGKKLFKKKLLFELVCKDEKGLSDILEKLNHSNKDKGEIIGFWSDLIDWINFDKYLNNHLITKKIDSVAKSKNDLILKIKFIIMKDLYNDLCSAKKTCLKVEDMLFDGKGVIENDLSRFYQLPLIYFPHSKHMFDEEDVIKQIIQEYPLSFKGKKIDNYSFESSLEFIEIRICDWIVGILGRTIKFLRQVNEDEMYKFIRSLNELQKSNIELLGKLIEDSNRENPYYIRVSDEFGLEGKLEWITHFKEYEVRAYLKRPTKREE
ncbi:hypothetical protein ACZ11_23830 [Lysinibacillus xylanilyticus]|uniref:DUF3800 domain-containing protein n=1 Tax=Lysinibacillus xylanilyticus TaxID=582475 RepID=A0A0K9F205_9BACI|nr:hypothetical protein [Lysinibacillus xylanilyticus]KMY28267.1 hypothetical protein ACZ11_23830 [Lysinibacillus xylanilyticus]